MTLPVSLIGPAAGSVWPGGGEPAAVASPASAPSARSAERASAASRTGTDDREHHVMRQADLPGCCRQVAARRLEEGANLDDVTTQIEILLWPRTLAALEAMAPVLELLDAD